MLVSSVLAHGAKVPVCLWHNSQTEVDYIFKSCNILAMGGDRPETILPRNSRWQAPLGPLSLWSHPRGRSCRWLVVGALPSGVSLIVALAVLLGGQQSMQAIKLLNVITVGF